MLNFPSLVVELVEMTPNAAEYKAHIRVMAISDHIDTKQKKKEPKPEATLEVKPSDDLGRVEGVEHEAGLSQEDRQSYITKQSFDIAVADGLVPDIKTQDLDYLKGLGLSVQQVRVHLEMQHKIAQRQFKIDEN